MTPDGISGIDWDRVEELARIAAEATFDDDEVASAEAVTQLIDYLKLLELKYGPLPSILATRADYTEDSREAVRLLEDAYRRAEQREDIANMTYVASSVAQRYVEDLSDFIAGMKWTDMLRQCLERFPDRTESETLVELESRLVLEQAKSELRKK